ncbi:MAG: hypothetical protein AAGD38_04665 [Acidobacteriota bacterium]
MRVLMVASGWMVALLIIAASALSSDGRVEVLPARSTLNETSVTNDVREAELGSVEGAEQVNDDVDSDPEVDLLALVRAEAVELERALRSELTENERLRDENRRLNAEVYEQEKEVTRYRSGLERAVARLNASCTATPAAPRRAKTSRTPRQSSGTTRDPASIKANIQVLGDVLRVFGTIPNGREQWRRGRLVIELVFDNGEVMSRNEQELEVPPGGRIHWEERFSLLGFTQGNLTARASYDG